MKTVFLTAYFPNGDSTELTFSDQYQFKDFNWGNIKEGEKIYIQDGQCIGTLEAKTHNAVWIAIDINK